MNFDERDGWRTAAALAGSAVLGIAALGATFWVFTGVVSTSAVSASQAVIATPGASGTTIPDAPTTSATPVAIPTPTGIPFTTQPVVVAPPELPTMTAPVPGDAITTSAAPGPVPGPPVVPPPPSPPSPAISNVSMSCHKNGDRVEGGLSFSTTTAVPVSLIAGGKLEQQGAAGPGVVSITAVGKRGSFCMATVGSQRFGPVSAS